MFGLEKWYQKENELFCGQRGLGKGGLNLQEGQRQYRLIHITLHILGLQFHLNYQITFQHFSFLSSKIRGLTPKFL